MNDEITPFNRALFALNDAFNADPSAVEKLISHRVPCNEELADHATVQVGETANGFDVGAIGLINGVIEPATGKRIAAKFDDITGKLIGFVEYRP